ncbi:tryptophan halogenase family protein [Sphingomonas sp. Root241]|uniref:tryptophan halogenase family protein n=1 Tax=Sphingomonas sp. Root241 TaxID=1736501 RepID=UPI0007003BFC|nr:tryptophan halogenase family protein [Sphingomonas sp. Root241]KRC78999.1 tryptophan halogenase [Sphingomonas sp. Root241]
MTDRGRAERAIERVVIVGGGTAGWMAATALSAHLAGTGVKITLIESSDIGTIGVGEATIPTIRRFYAQLGMSDAEVMQACEATAKFGIRFVDWLRDGQSFVHPFGRYGQDLKGVDFHHYWLTARASGDAAPLGDYSLGALLAGSGHATLPAPNPGSQLGIFDWALHFDAALFAQHMRRFAEKQGVTRLDARITDVKLRANDGFIEALTLDSGVEVAGDLFVDCSGFRSLLLGETLGVAYEDWSHWLLCDGAFAVQSERAGPPPSCTTVTARTAGWQWRIPLRAREGNGMVFSSRFQTDDDARDELLAKIPGKPTMEPRRLRFTPGRRAVAWAKNCVALGLASGFLEPLESTSIALIETGIERLKALFPDKDFDPAVVAEYNEQSAEEIERVRDFLILHYKLNGRSDAFWQACRDMTVPDTLKRKLELWRARGAFARYRWEMFSPPSWLAIYAGFEALPDRFDPAVAAVDPAQLTRSLEAMRRSLAETVADTPTHQEFLEIMDGAAAKGRAA